MMTLTKARADARKHGWTIRKDAFGEFMTYPHGTSMHHPSAYFSPCLDDCHATMCKLAFETWVADVLARHPVAS